MLTHAQPYLNKLKALSIYQINLFQTLCFMFKCNLNITPEVFSDLFRVKQVDKYTMRSQGQLIEPFKRTKISQFSITYRGPHLWSKVIANSKMSELTTLSSFKKNLNGHIFRHGLDTLQYF